MAALTITAGSVVTVSGTIRHGTSGATLTAGCPVYKDSADNLYKKCRANAAGTADADGITLNGASSGQPVSILPTGVINLGATLTVGTTYCVSDATAGEIVPIADLGSGDYVTILGTALTAANLSLVIDNVGIAKA